MTSVAHILLGVPADPLLAPFDYAAGETWKTRYARYYAPDGTVATCLSGYEFEPGDTEDDDEYEFIEARQLRVKLGEELSSDELARIRALYWAWLVRVNESLAADGYTVRWLAYNHELGP
jgi:hypothetical protein